MNEGMSEDLYQNILGRVSNRTCSMYTFLRAQ